MHVFNTGICDVQNSAKKSPQVPTASRLCDNYNVFKTDVWKQPAAEIHVKVTSSSAQEI